MACHICPRNAHCHQSFNGIQNCDAHHYSDVPVTPDDTETEPEAPTLSLGNRILWLTETRAASGIVKWIGRIPAISNGWSAGIEFDNVMPGGGNGDYRGRQYFQSRVGHALFLPVSDVLKVDSDNSGSGAERTSFFGRLQDSCSNFAHRKRRDATFGHFKQDCCSNCVRNDFPNYSHYCHHAPVYDRITTRRSLCYDDHPYEVYNACVPCGLAPNTPNHFHPENVANRKAEENNAQPCVVSDERYPVLRPLNRTYEEYPSDNFPRFNTFRKESFFGPRPSISLIDGFKEWVTCLVLGTNRRKRNSKIIFKDRKAVTSVFIAQNSQSLTGQRLSSFADYASVTFKKGSKKDIEEITDTADEKENSAIQQNSPPPKPRYRKKRPAPLPPIQYPGISNNNEKTAETNIVVKSDNANGKSDGTKEKEKRFKVVRSSSIRLYTTPHRRRRKKRKAPPPPPVCNTVGSDKNSKAIPKTSITAGTSIDKKSNKKDERPKQSKASLDVDKQELGSSSTKSKKVRHKVLYQHVKNGAIVGNCSDSGQESGSDASKNSSNSISFSEDDTDDDKYGLVKYGIINQINSSENSLNMPSTSNFVQYASDNSDVCLKISIQKTETNVVTVEEVSTPCSTTHYTIEEESSSSELSDIPVMKDTEKKAIMYQEPKLNSTDSSSVSTIEEAGEKSKTIFEELQMKPPTKGSVKDFVNAFNMLSAKNINPNPAVERRSSNGSVSIPKIEAPEESVEVKNKPKDSQSFPTKWQYQNNKTPNIIYASNKFLLPIAEESHNETSEHDGNGSVDDSKSPSPTKGKNISKNSVETKVSEVNDNSSKKCSHCSETHTQPSNNGVVPKSLKKRAAPRKDRILYESVRPLRNGPSSQASMAALSSLLQEKFPSGMKEGKLGNSSSAKSNPKLDQPIMVGLYIEDKSSHRGPIPLLVTPSMSLKKLKRQIEKEYEFPRHQQCWILGESFAVADEASLASYGVTEPGCPILLYVMAKDSKSQSLPSRASQRIRANPVQDYSDSSEEEVEVKPKLHKKSSWKAKQEIPVEVNDARKQNNFQGAIPKTDKSLQIFAKMPPSRKRNEAKPKKIKSEFHKKWEKEFEKKADYHHLIALDDVDLVASVEKFECPVCFLDVDPGQGVTLQDCLHSFCRECLAGAIQFSETAIVKCPFRNDEYSCESHLQEREIKSLVTSDVYEKHLQRSMALAESQAQDSFHCKTPDCPGWCLFEDNVNTFLCPVCKHTNCLTCTAIHEGKNCRQYQDDVAFRCDSSEEARKTKEYLQNMVDNGEAMRCPQCQVILMKKWGCDWLKCSMCHTEVCWVTKGPRWGPGGRGDTSGGCKCMVNGARCHPKCSYCH